MTTIKEFKREYTRAVSEGYAAVFAGAGLSRASGYISWKDLVRPLAEEIGLDVEKENDLIAVAQFFVNQKRNRAAVNQRILNEYTQSVSNNDNIQLLTKLPISTYWTTNYDELLEQGLKTNNRKADIKTTQESLAANIYDRDAVVYKMHGDVRCPNKAVLIKDDYEIYEQERSLFRTALQGELVTKTFLFVGFSFDDPNLNYILSQIRVLLGTSLRDHYCFFEKVKPKEGQSKEDYHYDLAKQQLRIEDLQRYGIQAVELDSYDEITDILRDVERGYLLKNVFISGSNAKTDAPWNEEQVSSFVYMLANKLVNKNYRIVSGFGLGVGSSVINGALKAIMSSEYKRIEEHLCLRPFPQNISDPEERKTLWSAYRKDMLQQAGIAIFIFGNKEKGDEIVIADGMLEEFSIAMELGKIVIPVCSTGGAATEIYNKAIDNKKQFPYLEKYWDRLKDTTDISMLSDLIYEIVSNQQYYCV